MRPIKSDRSKEANDLLKKAEYLLKKAEDLDMIEHEGEDVPAFVADGKGPNDKKSKKSKDKEEDESEEEDEEDEEDESEEDCPECGSKMNKMGGCSKMECGGKMMAKADKATKDKYCMKTFGKKYSECSEKQKGQCDKAHGKMAKGADMGSQPNFITSFDSKPQNVMFAAESGGQTRNAYYSTNQHLYNGEDVTNKGSISESVNVEALSPKMNPHDSIQRQVENGVLSKAEEALAKAKEDLAKAVCRQCGGNQFSGCKLGFGMDCPGLSGTGHDNVGAEEGHRDSAPPSEWTQY